MSDVGSMDSSNSRVQPRASLSRPAKKAGLKEFFKADMKDTTWQLKQARKRRTTRCGAEAHAHAQADAFHLHFTTLHCMSVHAHMQACNYPTHLACGCRDSNHSTSSSNMSETAQQRYASCSNLAGWNTKVVEQGSMHSMQRGGLIHSLQGRLRRQSGEIMGSPPQQRLSVLSAGSDLTSLMSMGCQVGIHAMPSYTRQKPGASVPCCTSAGRG
jgi:hypothetical protein